MTATSDITTPIADAILALMSDGRERTAEDVWRRLKLPPDAAKAALSRMAQDQSIRSKSHKFDRTSVQVYRINRRDIA